jgi:translation initiation factor 3 subunit A
MVLEKLRLKVEDKVKDAVSRTTGTLQKIDLEVWETPETLLINSVKDNSQNEQQAVTNSLRFLWEVYKLSLNLLKTNGKMVAAYKDSAIGAIEFCEKYKLANECRNLSETLRSHLQNIIRLQSTQNSSSLTYMIKLDEDTLSNLIPIREKLMEVCMDLGLWQEAFRAAEDTRQLISEGKVSPSILARYWHGLSKIFWKAGKHLFHAYALYLYYYQNKKFNKNFKKENLLASNIVLSILAVPTYTLGSEITGITTESILSQEINIKLSTMLMQTGMITREQMIDLLNTNNLLEIANKEIRELFNLLENKFSPLTLSHLVKPLLNKIKENTEFRIYVPSIEQLLVGRVLAQLSKCYKSLKLETLFKLIDFISPDTLEKYILEVSIKTSLCIKIDHSASAIYFNDVPDILEACTQFNKVKENLIKAYNIINKEQDEERRKNTVKNVFSNLEAITNQAYENRQALADDVKKISRERDEILRKKEEEDRKIKEVEKKKLEVEQKQREKTLKLTSGLIGLEQEKKDLKLLIIHNIIEKMKSIGFSSKEMSFNGKKLEKMTEEELLEIGPEEIGKIYNRLYENSIRDRQIKVKQQQKSLEYNERAKREYMSPLIIEKWAESTQQEIEQKKKLIKEKYEKDSQLKKQIERIKDFKSEFINEETAKASEIFKKVYNDWNEKMKSHYKSLILINSKAKKEEDRIAKIELEKKIKEDDEKRRKPNESKLQGDDWRNQDNKPKNKYKAIAPKESTEKVSWSKDTKPNTVDTYEEIKSEKQNTYTVKDKPIERAPPAPNKIFRKDVPTKNEFFTKKTTEETKTPSQKPQPEKVQSGPKKFKNSAKKKEIDQDGFTKVKEGTGHS